jgi:hypothetical protein
MPYFIDVMASAFEMELQKIAAHKHASGLLSAKTLVPAAVGILGYEALRRANKDRKIGRAVRMQGQGQGY